MRLTGILISTVMLAVMTETDAMTDEQRTALAQINHRYHAGPPDEPNGERVVTELGVLFPCPAWCSRRDRHPFEWFEDACNRDHEADGTGVTMSEMIGFYEVPTDDGAPFVPIATPTRSVVWVWATDGDDAIEADSVGQLAGLLDQRSFAIDRARAFTHYQAAQESRGMR